MASSLINLEKRYTTLRGDRVRLYVVDIGSNYSVHGAMWIDGQWLPLRWNKYGEVDPFYSLDNSAWDLKEEKSFKMPMRCEVIVSTYPCPMPKEVKKFNGKRCKITIEEMPSKK